MKIAIVGAIDSPIKKDSSAGTEIWTYNFAESLLEKGHRVTLFASKGSFFSGELVEVATPSDVLDAAGIISKRKFVLFSINQMIEVLKSQDQFDLIHLSVFSLPYALPFVKLLNRPVTVTMHQSFPDDEDTKLIFEKFYEPTYIFISKNQASLKYLPQNYEIIYNGIKIDDFNFQESSGQDLLFWMNRVSPEKGAQDAVKIAQKSGKKITLAGPIRQPEYFETSIKPFLNEDIQYLGTLGLAQKVDNYKKAKLFLMPIHWEEPFGFVMVESMACGTPVLAYHRGSVPEIVKSGKTGFICSPDDLNCMIEKVKEIYRMPNEKYQEMRLACRKEVEEKFTIKKMVDGYEALFNKLIKAREIK